MSEAAKLTDERLRELRHKFDTMLGGGTVITEGRCLEVLAVIDELLRLRTKPDAVLREALTEAGRAIYVAMEYVNQDAVRPSHLAQIRKAALGAGAALAASTVQPQAPASLPPDAAGERQEPTHERIQHVYTRAGRAVVCGIPDDSHNCDQMACSSVEHILARVPHTVDEKPARDAMTDWRNGENMAVQNSRSAFVDLVDAVTGKPIDPMKRTYGGVTREQFDAARSAAVVEQAADERKDIVRDLKILRTALSSYTNIGIVNRAIVALSPASTRGRQ